jgi:hypothetical protein
MSHVADVTKKVKVGTQRMEGTESNSSCQTAKKKSKFQPGVVVHTCNPGTWEVEAGGSQV